MQKKSERGNGKDVNKVRGPKQDREERSDNQKYQGNTNDHQDKSGKEHGRSKDALERNAERDDERRNRKKMDGGNAPKNGCFPKLFMLLLPFAAVGTYFFLRL